MVKPKQKAVFPLWWLGIQSPGQKITAFGSFKKVLGGFLQRLQKVVMVGAEANEASSSAQGVVAVDKIYPGCHLTHPSPVRTWSMWLREVGSWSKITGLVSGESGTTILPGVQLFSAPKLGLLDFWRSNPLGPLLSITFHSRRK